MFDLVSCVAGWKTNFVALSTPDRRKYVLHLGLVVDKYLLTTYLL